MTSQPLNVAVSYSHQNKPEVMADIEALSASGISCWFDEQLRGGALWREEIAQRLMDADAIVAFLSRTWLRSEYCIQEIGFAMDLGKPILCIQMEPVELTPGLKMSLGPRQAIRRFEYADSVAEYQARVLEALREIRGSVGAEDAPVTHGTTLLFSDVLQLQYQGAAYSVSGTAGERFTIGRNQSCQLVLRSNFASRVHGYVSVRAGDYFYHDTSRNGTLLVQGGSEHRLLSEEWRLDRHGELIIGDAIIHFRVL